MADVTRTLSALQALLADNSAGDISAQDVRDFLVSTYQPQAVNGFRLTLEAGVPISTSDQTGKTTLYWTPYAHNCVGLYDGSSWKQWTSAELSLALGTLTSGANYDVFLWDTSGLALVLGPAWSSDTSRGTGAGTTELILQDGVWVNKVSISGGPGAKAGRYLGTIWTTSTTATEDSTVKRFVWNASNRVRLPMYTFESADSWTYASVTWRAMNNSASNRMQCVVGLAGAAAECTVFGAGNGGGSNDGAIGIGEDSTSSLSAGALGLFGFGLNGAQPTTAHLRVLASPGFHYYSALERAGAFNGPATVTFYGDAGGNYMRAGITGTVEG